MNAVLTTLSDWLLGPLAGWPPGLTMALISLVTGVGMLVLFRCTSNQSGIRRAKAQVVSHLLAIRLFKDDPWVTVRELGRALHANLGYLRHATFPLLIMIGPVALILIQLDLRFELRPLAPGERTVVAVTLAAEDRPDEPPLELVPVARAYAVETPPLPIASLREIDWRIRALEPGRHALNFRRGDRSFTKELVVGGAALARVSGVRPGGGFLDRVRYPGEPPLAADLGVAAITVDYPPRPFAMLGLRLAWWLAFFILSLVFAFLLRKPLRVEA